MKLSRLMVLRNTSGFDLEYISNSCTLSSGSRLTIVKSAISGCPRLYSARKEVGMLLALGRFGKVLKENFRSEIREVKGCAVAEERGP